MRTTKLFRLNSADFEHIEQGLADNSHGLRNSSILLTGASGFFGMWMLESLVWLSSCRGLHIRLDVVVRNAQAFQKMVSPTVIGHVRLIEGDLATMALPAKDYKYIIHLASEHIQPRVASTFFEHMKKSVDAAHTVIALAKACATDSVLFTSSGAVYGDYLSLHASASPFKENIRSADEILNEKAIYAETKRYIELLFSSASIGSGFKTKIARCFSFVGPFLPLNSNYAIGNFIRDALEGRDIVIKGDGKSERSYLYTSDLVVYLLLILLKGRPGIPYNVGSPEAFSILDIATKVRDVSGTYSKVQVLNSGSAVGAGDSYLPDLANLRLDFGMCRIVGIDDAIQSTLDWNRQN